MKLATKAKLIIVTKVAACVLAAAAFVSFTALFVVAPIHQYYLAHEQQKLTRQIQRTSQTLDEVNEVMIRINKTYRELHHP